MQVRVQNHNISLIAHQVKLNLHRQTLIMLLLQNNTRAGPTGLFKRVQVEFLIQRS